MYRWARSRESRKDQASAAKSCVLRASRRNAWVTRMAVTFSWRQALTALTRSRASW